MFGAIGLPRFLGAILCAGLATMAPMPRIITAALVVVLLLAVNAVEAWPVETGRPLLLLRLPGQQR